MGFKDVLELVGGLALFLFGMQLMGNALEKKAGSRLKTLLEKMTGNTFKGFLLGLVVTSIIQSSSATTVMVVGFVNSGVMTLKQSIGIIMGANLGTTITAWILSLTGVTGDLWYIQMFKPSTFVPILAFIGIFLMMFSKSNKKKDTSVILLGFATLMTGMDIMSAAVAGLKEVPEFTNILIKFSNPVLGVLAGAVLTAIIQSSSASVGILQALSSTGAVSLGASIPIIMGQNIGTCVTAMLSSVGTNKNAKRTAFVHLYFNVFGSIVLLIIYSIVKKVLNLGFFDTIKVDAFAIAIAHTTIKIIFTIIWLPFIKFLEKLAVITVKDKGETEHYEMLDERLLQTPAIAVERARTVTAKMAEISVSAIHKSFELLTEYSDSGFEEIKSLEKKADKYEDKLGSYLVRVSSTELTDDDSAKTAMLLHLIGDFERISDHAVNIIESADEIVSKKVNFSGAAINELKVLISAVDEIVDLAHQSFVNNDLECAAKVEPLEQVVDNLRDELKKKHISRLQKGECTIELGFILTDLLTNLERVSDHCSNIAACIIESTHHDMAMHNYLKNLKKDQGEEFKLNYEFYSEKYKI